MTSIKKLLREWVQHQSLKWSAVTQRNALFWGSYFARILKNTYKISSIHKVSIKILNKYITNIRKRCKLNYVNVHKRNIKSFFAWCVEMNIILFSPVSHWRYKSENKTQHTLTIKEMKSILSITPQTLFDIEIGVIIELMYGTGIRLSELISLDIFDIDFQRNIIQVNKGKGQVPRILPLIPKVKKQLKKFIVNIRPKLAKKQENAVFVGHKGARIHKSCLQKYISITAKKVNIHFSCHTLRRTFATHLLENGTNVIIIKKLLGHKKLETTQKYLNIGMNYLQSKNIKHPRDQIQFT